MAQATSAKTPPLVRVGRLDTLARVRWEARQLYVDGRQGKVQAADASRLASLLALIATLLRDGALDQLEQRVQILEAARTLRHD